MLSFFQNLLDLFFPPTCLGCRAEGFFLCPKCIASIPLSYQKTNARGVSISYFFNYGKSVLLTKSIKKAKYKHMKSLLTLLTKRIIASIPDDLKNTEYVLIPVPMHFFRKNFRGYNQSEIIAAELATQIPHWKVENLVKRVKNTPQQAHLSRAQRLVNVIDAFEVQKNKLPKSTKLLLIDDIVTTGSTLWEMKQVLEKSGFEEIKALTLGKA